MGLPETRAHGHNNRPAQTRMRRATAHGGSIDSPWVEREPNAAHGNACYASPALVLGFLALSFLLLIGVSIYAIVDVASRSDREFKAIGSERTTWLLLVLFVTVPAAIAYLVGVRPRLLAAPPVPLALPGWYPDPTVPTYLRYHDGVSWTVHVAPMLPAAAPPPPPQPPPQRVDAWGRPY